MKEDEFFKWLKSQPIEDKLVCVKYKYDHEHNFTQENELLLWDNEVNGGSYVWLNDWWEGQQCVEILCCVNVADIDLLSYENLQTYFNNGGK